MSVGVCHASEFRASDCLYYSAIARTAVSYSLISFTERHFTRHSFAAGKGIPRFAPIPSPPNQAFCIRPCVPPAEFQPDLVRHCALRRRTRQTVSFSRANVTKFNDKRARHVKLRYVHSTWTESAWSSQAAVVNACYPMQQLHSACAERSCNKSTQLRDAFIGQASQRHDLIGCSETRTVGAQSVRALWTPPLEYTSSVLVL